LPKVILTCAAAAASNSCWMRAKVVKGFTPPSPDDQVVAPKTRTRAMPCDARQRMAGRHRRRRALLGQLRDVHPASGGPVEADSATVLRR